MSLINAEDFSSENEFSKVAIIGLGYVGLPLAILFIKKGFKVIGIDTDSNKIKSLYENRSYLTDLSDEEIKLLMTSGNFEPTKQFERIKEVNAIILCVPTPLRDHVYPDLSYLQSAVKELSPYIANGALIILESSTYPGTTEEVLMPMLEKEGRKVGKDFYLGFSPERIDPGNKDFKLENIPKVISGVTNICKKKIHHLYSKVFETLVPVSSPKAAELTKLLENSQRFINISFMNEMVKVSHAFGIDIWEVIDAANTKPYGFTAFYPGPGIGGHCIPVDPLYLTWKAKQYNIDTKFIKLSKEINDNTPNYVIDRIIQLIEEKQSLNNSRVLLVGMTYKKDINDMRESSSIAIFEGLISMGINVSYHDPYIPDLSIMEKKFYSVNLSKELLEQSDCVAILADHTDLPYDLIIKHAPLIFDTRNKIKDIYPHIKRL